MAKEEPSLIDSVLVRRELDRHELERDSVCAALRPDRELPGDPKALELVGYRGDTCTEFFATDVVARARASFIWRRIEPRPNGTSLRRLQFLKQALK